MAPTSHSDAQVSELVRSANERIASRRRTLAELVLAREEAAREAMEALRIAEELWGCTDDRLVAILMLLAACVGHRSGKNHHISPVPYLLRAIDIAKNSQPENFERLAVLYRKTGLALRSQNNLSDSKSLLMRAVESFDRIGQIRDVAYCLGLLAGILMQLDPEEALPVCSRRLEIETVERPKSLHHFLALEQLGVCLTLLGNGEDSLIVLLQAMDLLLENTKGVAHPSVGALEVEIAKARLLADKS